MRTENGITNKAAEAMIRKGQHKLITDITKATKALNKLEPFSNINVQYTQNTGII